MKDYSKYTDEELARELGEIENDDDIYNEEIYEEIGKRIIEREFDNAIPF